MSEAAQEALDDALAQQLSGGGTVSADNEAPAAQEEKFDFAEEFQSRVAALALRDNGFARRTEGLITPESFENQAEAILISLGQDFYDKYRQVPQDLVIWKQVLKQALETRRIKPDHKADVLAKFQELMRAPVDNVDYAVDEVATFARRQAVAKAYMDSVEDVQEGRIEKVQERLTKAFQIGAVAEFQEVDYWSGIDSRTDIRKEMKAGRMKPRGITTGIPRIDDLLFHQGWGRKELSVIMGGAKKGKSMGLGHHALRASIAGYNAIYFTLEVADQIISERMDANITGIAMDAIPDRIMEVDAKIKDAARGAGHLKVVEFPTGSLRPSDVRRILDKYRADGIKFDVIVVDYADIMAPDHRTGEPREDSKEIWIQLRAIAGEQDAAVLTATQTNRDGFKSSTAKAEHAADDFNKIRIADLVISINRDDEERKRGEARLYFAASRNQGGEYTVRVTQNMEAMQFITGVLGIE